jgi:hypothetical protein
MQITQKLLLLLFFVLSSPISSQELISNKIVKQDRSTTNWDFICDNYALTGVAKVQITKNNNGGSLKLAIETNDATFTISGTTYIYLSDGSIIICYDKKNRETRDNQIISYYALSPLEMGQLKKTNIQSLRFNIDGKRKKFGSQIGNFTAVNKQKHIITANDSREKSFDTAKEITALYK